MTFTTYYGAAGAEVDALDALQAVEAEAYSLGQSSTEDGPTLGTPSTFVFGFTGIGGASAFEPVAVAGDDVTVAEGATVALDASASIRSRRNDHVLLVDAGGGHRRSRGGGHVLRAGG